MSDQPVAKKKLTLAVRNVETLESRATPHTACVDDRNYGCCQTSIAQSQKLTAVAFF